MTNDEDDLRVDFARLRRVDARRTPSFDVLRKAPKVRPLRPVVLAVLPLVAAAAALLLVCSRPTENEPPQSSAAPADVTLAVAHEAPLPLDFLLQTHGASAGLRGSFDSDFLLRAPKDHTP